jgi:Calx-beta domain/Domain of unknown function (DUF4114)/von Willebrand factor type A domain
VDPRLFDEILAFPAKSLSINHQRTWFQPHYPTNKKMADIKGTNGSDFLRGSIADDKYIDIGVGSDIIKDSGGNNLIDLSNATSGAIVNLAPGKTSSVGTGSFLLSSIINGKNPDVVFVADVSGSTDSIAEGINVGDQNGDGISNTILDGEIAGFTALNQSLIDQGLGDTARVTLAVFDEKGRQVGLTVTPQTDANKNGVYDIVDSLKTLQPGTSTAYDTGLQQAIDIFKTLKTPAGKGNLIFLSDGAPNADNYADKVAELNASGVNISAFGVGNSIPLEPLLVIDPQAQTFTDVNQLIQIFSAPEGFESRTGATARTSITSLIGTKFDDIISGNGLNNTLVGGDGNDVISGINENNFTPGQGEIDVLTGNAGADSFILDYGYYDDGSDLTPGISDYALITDFNEAEDKIILGSQLSKYRLAASPIAGITGQALYFDKPGIEPDELIAVLQGVNNLTLTSPAFSVTTALPRITITGVTDATEQGQIGSFRFNRTGDPTNSLTVKLGTLDGTATVGDDYQVATTDITFSANSSIKNVAVNALRDKLVEGSETINLKIASNPALYRINTDNRPSIVIKDSPSFSSISSKPGLLQLNYGDRPSIPLLFTKLGNSTNNRSEVGMFLVDDDSGTVNNTTPNDSGYLTQVRDRSKVLFSSLGNNATDASLDNQVTRSFDLPINSKIGFYLAVNGSMDDVSSSSTSQKILFSFPATNSFFTNSKTSQNLDVTKIAFDDSGSTGDLDFDDFVFQIENAFDTVTLGIDQQGTKEVYDFSSVATSVNAAFEVKRDAGYNNHVGFYKIESVDGTIKVGNTLIRPDEDGYRQAIVKGLIAGVDLVGTNGQVVKSNGVFLGGALYAPILIADANTANANFSNVYTAYSQGNADKVDHIRLLADNTFGFEDLVGGGDRDFNDVIVKATFTKV